MLYIAKVSDDGSELSWSDDEVKALSLFPFSLTKSSNSRLPSGLSLPYATAIRVEQREKLFVVVGRCHTLPLNHETPPYFANLLPFETGSHILRLHGEKC